MDHTLSSRWEGMREGGDTWQKRRGAVFYQMVLSSLPRCSREKIPLAWLSMANGSIGSRDTWECLKYDDIEVKRLFEV